MVVYIMRGLPGSGKSTRAGHIKEQLEQSYDEVKLLSYDDYFIKDGEYEFSKESYYGPTGARFKCMKDYLEAISNGYQYIILDNTNPTWSHCESYVKIAIDNGYDVMFCESDSVWAKDVEKCAERNTHGVPIEEIKRRSLIYEKSEDLLQNCIEYCGLAGIINTEKLFVSESLCGVIRKIYPCKV